MNKSDKRAIRIVELEEELTEAKKIIHEFLFPGDIRNDQRIIFKKKAAKFIGAKIYFDNENNEKSIRKDNIIDCNG